MNKIIRFFNEAEKIIKDSREEQEKIKKDAADEINATTKSIFDLFDEAERYVDSFNDDKEINRVTNYFKSRMKKGK